MTDSELLKLCNEFLTYSNGSLLWKKTSSYTPQNLSKAAGWKDSRGYLNFKLKGKTYKSHRIIYLLFNGYLPKCIDHINGIRDDNRIENLREVTQRQNCCNSKPRITNTSGYKGVFFRKKVGNWQASISYNYKHIYLGVFDNPHDAARAYNLASKMYHGEYGYINPIINKGKDKEGK